MTDIQILTIGIAVIVPVSTLLLSHFTNARQIEQLIDAKLDTLRAEIKTLKTGIDAGFETLKHQIEKHELEHHR